MSPAKIASFFKTDRRVLALAIARMADALGNSFLVIVLPLYVASGIVDGYTFGLSQPMIAGLVLALFGIASSITQPLAGRLSDLAGKRRAFVIGGLLVFTVSNLGFIWADNYVLLFALRIVQGTAAAFTITASIALVNEVSRMDSRGGNMGIYNSFRLVGFGAGPLIASVIIESGPFVVPGIGAEVTGFEVTFYIAAVAALVSAVLVVFIVRDPAGIQPSDRRFKIAILDRTGTRTLDPIFALGIATLVMAACLALLSTLEPQVNERLNQSPILFAIEFVALILTLAVFQPFVGRLTDEYGRKAFVVYGLIALVPTTLVQGFVFEPWQMIIARMLQGVAGACVFAPALALAGDLADSGQSGAQLSVLTVSFGLGIAGGQILAGAVVGHGFYVPFLAGAVLALVGSVVVRSEVTERHIRAAT
ncbi:MFS transporter [Longibacter salinarum]|uniref:MFS transporter n=1 Tax=Longibacter salinarum TaxID=1850348 RepID=A0A2A8D239_9BACT|nr:MFS transporter [Longibacter salinarum]PEN14944.1 MFS transporter [Longibacter salinarum]